MENDARAWRLPSEIRSLRVRSMRDFCAFFLPVGASVQVRPAFTLETDDFSFIVFFTGFTCLAGVTFVSRCRTTREGVIVRDEPFMLHCFERTGESPQKLAWHKGASATTRCKSCWWHAIIMLSNVNHIYIYIYIQYSTTWSSAYLCLQPDSGCSGLFTSAPTWELHTWPIMILRTCTLWLDIYIYILLYLYIQI